MSESSLHIDCRQALTAIKQRIQASQTRAVRTVIQGDEGKPNE